MKYIQMNSEGKYRGQDYTPDTILEVSESLGDSMILGGRGTPSTKELYDAQKVDSNDKAFADMTSDELSEVDYRSLNKDPLVEFATACGLDVDGMNMKNIIALIESSADL